MKFARDRRASGLAEQAIWLLSLEAVSILKHWSVGFGRIVALGSLLELKMLLRGCDLLWCEHRGRIRCVRVKLIVTGACLAIGLLA